MENKLETTTIYWGHIGIMEKTVETIIRSFWGRCLNVSGGVGFCRVLGGLDFGGLGFRV